jgi:uncharacterized repeat protein (TIGR01451 family)
VLGLVPPANVTLPLLNGVVRVNDDVSGTPGTWTGTPTPNVSGVVARCDLNGNNCFALTAADPASYRVAESDYGWTLRYRVTGHNFAGTFQAFSPIHRVLPYAPVNLDKPTLGSNSPESVPAVGDTLIASPGRWRTLEPETHGYQFQQCSTFFENDCTNIAGATSATFRLPASVLGKRIRVLDIATNSGGSTSANSFSTYEVAPPRASSPRPPDTLPVTPPPPGPRPDPTPPPPPPGGGRPTSPNPDLAITMTSNPPPGSLVGVSQITYTIDVTNLTDVFASNVKVNDFLPSNLTLAPGSPGSPNPTVVDRPLAVCTAGFTCSIGDLPGRTTVRVIAVTNVTSVVYTSNTVSVSALQPDPNTANNFFNLTHF